MDIRRDEANASSHGAAIYNRSIPHMFTAYSRLGGIAVSLLLIIVGSAQFSRAADWSAPEKELAQQIVAVTGPGALALEVTNRSSLRSAEVDEIRDALQAQMAGLGVVFVEKDQAAATVQVSLSEVVRNLLWVAQIQQGGNSAPTVVMVSAPRSASANLQGAGPALSIRKTLLLVEDARILDAAVLDTRPQHLLVLDENGVTIYRFQDNHWQTDQVFVIPHDRPWPRDLRGRIIPRKDHLFDAFLPGVFCQASVSAQLIMNCHSSDDPWPLAEGNDVKGFFSPSRNFFTGVLSPGIGKQTVVPEFYSAAPLPRPNYILWLIAGVDGRIHLLDGINDQIASNANWGSDIAAIRSGCGSGTQILASGNAAGPLDSVRAFEVVDREPVPASAGVDFGGQVTSLWTEAGGTSAIGIVHNLQTGTYEAYRLSIACGQ
jgi:hypothetical protein